MGVMILGVGDQEVGRDALMAVAAAVLDHPAPRKQPERRGRKVHDDGAVDGHRLFPAPGAF
jgi:hypothetical protein